MVTLHRNDGDSGEKSLCKENTAVYILIGAWQESKNAIDITPSKTAHRRIVWSSRHMYGDIDTAHVSMVTIMHACRQDYSKLPKRNCDSQAQMPVVIKKKQSMQCHVSSSYLWCN